MVTGLMWEASIDVPRGRQSSARRFVTMAFSHL
jgi:hypothetical protein